MKKSVAMILILTMLLTLCACGQTTNKATHTEGTAPVASNKEIAGDEALPEEAQANPVTLKVAVKSSGTAANSIATQMWCDAVNEADVGIEMLFYPDGQLGSETDVMQQIIMGEPLIVNAEAGHLEPYAPELGLMSGPYFVESLDDFDLVVQTPWFADQMEAVQNAGLYVVSADMHFGQRHLIATKEVRTPADLAGLKIRSQPYETSLAMIEAMGGTPVPLAFSEIYEALSNGVVDGEENPLNTIYNAKHHETKAKVVSLTGHQSNISLYVMNLGIYNSLTEQQQQVLSDTAREAFTYYNQVLYPEATQEAIDAFAKQGVTVVEDVDIAAFKEATQTVYDLIDTEGVYDEVMAQIEALR